MQTKTPTRFISEQQKQKLNNSADNHDFALLAGVALLALALILSVWSIVA